eukprot:496838-Hanusia_phi.AAC.1
MATNFSESRSLSQLGPARKLQVETPGRTPVSHCDGPGDRTPAVRSIRSAPGPSRACDRE